MSFYLPPLKLLALSAAGTVFGIISAKAQTCSTPPSCDALGFTKSVDDCSGQDTLKCPFDQSKLYCSGKYSIDTAVGDIYYSDGTASSALISGKTPIGIVASVSNGHGLVISLKQTQSVWWQSNGRPDPIKTTCTGSGAELTECLGSYGRNDVETFPAARYCYTLPDDGSESDGYRTGSWFLPTPNELKKVYPAVSLINLSMEKISGTKFSETANYWTSHDSSGGPQGLLAFTCSDKICMDNYEKTSKQYTRCLRSF